MTTVHDMNRGVDGADTGSVPAGGGVDRVLAAARLVLPALVVALIQLAGSFGTGAHQPTARPLDPLGVALLLAGPAALLARRRFPVPTLAVVSAVLLGYLAARYPYGPAALSFAVAVVSGVYLGHRQASWTIAGLAYLGLAGVAWLRAGQPNPVMLSGSAAWLLVILTAAELARARRERLARERRAQAEAAERLATEERLRIARDLHDVLAHHVSLINVQAGTALHLLDEQPGLAREALTAIKASSKEVLVELRNMLGVLRRVDEGAPRSPVAGLAGLDELVERVRAGGTPVDVRRVGAPRPLPAAVDTAAFRIVQEALTNVHRHARASHATVLVDNTGSQLVVQVDDDGRGQPSPGVPLGGNGIAGMRERAAALGGRLTVGPRQGGGFRVHAVLPTGEPRTAGQERTPDAHAPERAPDAPHPPAQAADAPHPPEQAADEPGAAAARTSARADGPSKTAVGGPERGDASS